MQRGAHQVATLSITLSRPALRSAGDFSTDNFSAPEVMAFAAVYRPVSTGIERFLGTQHAGDAAEMPEQNCPTGLSGCWRAIFSSAPFAFPS